MKSNSGKHYEEHEIRKYLENQLDSVAREEVLNHIEACRQCFTLYMEIREIDYLAHLGQPVSDRLRSEVKRMVKQAKGHLIRVRFKVLKDKFIMMRGDSENLEFQGVRANFAYRGKTQEGPISFTHKINEHTVTLTLSPIEGKKHYKVAIALDKKEKISVKMLLQGKPVESIKDLSKQSSFLTVINRGEEIDLLFEKSGKELFTVNLGID